MLKKFFSGVWFNVTLAIIAAVLIVAQENFVDSGVSFLNLFAIGAFAAIGFSVFAYVLQFLAFRAIFQWKPIAIGSAFGIVSALFTALIVA